MANRNTETLEDRIGKYLVGHLDTYIFDELSENFLKKNGFDDILTGVPVPVNKKELTKLSIKSLAVNMAVVIGCDVNFQHRDSYIEFIIRNYTKDFAKFLVGEGIDSAAKNGYLYACILFRAAFLIDHENADAIYCYGRACKDCYEAGDSEEYVGLFKAEALEAFEKVTIKKPDFDMGFYFLGYGYLNLGMYVKAKLTFESFLELSANEEMKEEVSQWIVKLEEPVKIEAGYNLVVSGRFQEGIDALIPYTEDENFNKWWPLWHYLGVANKELGYLEMAEDYFLNVLKLSPSNLESMEELVKVYEAMGNSEKAEKYRTKISVIKGNMEKDKALALEEVKQ